MDDNPDRVIFRVLNECRDLDPCGCFPAGTSRRGIHTSPGFIKEVFDLGTLCECGSWGLSWWIAALWEVVVRAALHFLSLCN